MARRPANSSGGAFSPAAPCRCRSRRGSALACHTAPLDRSGREPSAWPETQPGSGRTRHAPRSPSVRKRCVVCHHEHEKLGGGRRNFTNVVTAPSANHVTNRHDVWPFATGATTSVAHGACALFARGGVAHRYDALRSRSPRCRFAGGFRVPRSGTRVASHSSNSRRATTSEQSVLQRRMTWPELRLDLVHHLCPPAHR